MAININWGEVLKTAGPTIATYAGAKTQNRGVENTNALTQARDTEVAAVNRARAEIEARNAAVNEARGGREAEAQAFRNAQIAALMKNMEDVKFADVSRFRSRVPELHFQGGSRPSAFGAEGKQLADVMQNRAMQQLMAPPAATAPGGPAVPRGGDGAAMPAYQPAEQKGSGFWENALGIAGLGATVAGAAFPKAAAAAAPSVAAQVARNPMAGVSFGGGAGTAAKGLPVSFGGQTFTSPTMASSLAGSGTTGASTAAKTAGTAAKGPSGLAKMFGATSGGATGALGAANMVAGPAGLVAGIIAPYLPAGKARTAADWASKGATIGSVIPGVGTAIGAGAGAVAGAIKGHQNATVGSRKDLAKKLGYGNLDLLYRALEGMGPEGQRLRHEGLNVIGKQDKKGNELWKQQVAALLGRR